MDIYLKQFGSSIEEFRKARKTGIRRLAPSSEFSLVMNYYDVKKHIVDINKPHPTDSDYRNMYIYGHEIPANKMHILDACDYRRRFVFGNSIPDEKMPLIDNTSYALRYCNGYDIPKNMDCGLSNCDKLLRESGGFDYEMRPYKLSYLLGYEIPHNVKIEITDRDRAIHSNLELNEACILALAEMKASGKAFMTFSIPREFAADFDYISHKSAPTWLELRMPNGEMAFRAEDPANDPAAGAMINQVCDGLCSPEWGARRVGDMRGVVLLEPVG